MNDRNETERLREAFAATSPDDRPSADCPAATLIWDAAQGEVGPKELRSLLQHVAVCPTCTESWRLAKELDKDDHIAELDEDAHVGQLPDTGWHGLRYASAAAALVAVVFVGVTVRYGVSPEPISRSGESQVLELLSMEQKPRSNCLLRWTEFEGARYNVRIASEDLNILSEADWLEQPEYLVPEAHLANAPDGEALSVYVEVHRLREGAIASQTFSFQCN